MKPDRNDLLHVESCALLALLLLAFLPWWAACSATLAVGIGKEVYDKEHGGVPSWSDLLCDCAGVALGIILTIL